MIVAYFSGWISAIFFSLVVGCEPHALISATAFLGLLVGLLANRGTAIPPPSGSPNQDAAAANRGTAVPARRARSRSRERGNNENALDAPARRTSSRSRRRERGNHENPRDASVPRGRPRSCEPANDQQDAAAAAARRRRTPSQERDKLKGQKFFEELQKYNKNKKQ